MADLMATLAGRRILLAEDNVLNQELTRRLLEKTGAVLTVTGDGAEALAALDGGSYDCVLMDVQMPVMDGLEATRRLRADPRHAALPVLALTANAYASDREACLAAGMNEFLVKPIEPDLFYLQLARCFDATLAGPVAARVAPEREDEGTTELICLSVLATLVDNDTDTMQRLLAVFLDQAASTLAEMTTALALRDAPRLAALGHRLKSSARAVGANRFAAICAAIEQCGGRIDRVAEMLTELRPLLFLMKAQVEAALPPAADPLPALHGA
jgi:CheY-like chemotaxis protein